MKVLQIKGLETSVVYDMGGMNIPTIAGKFGTTAKSLSSLAFNLASKGEIYLMSEVVGTSSEDTTVITIVDPNNTYLRKGRVYSGISTKEVVTNIVSFLESENLTDNLIYQMLKKIGEATVPQVDTIFKSLVCLGINVHLTSKFKEHVEHTNRN